MQNPILRRHPNFGGSDSIKNAVADNSLYADTSIIFPDLSPIMPNDGVDPLWLLDVLRGNNRYAEYTSVKYYTQCNSFFQDFGDPFLGVAMIEMNHLDKGQDIVYRLHPESELWHFMEFLQMNTFPALFENVSPESTFSVKDALEILIEGEIETRDQWLIVRDKSLNSTDSPTCFTMSQAANKFAMDEDKHISVFTNLYNSL